MNKRIIRTSTDREFAPAIKAQIGRSLHGTAMASGASKTSENFLPGIARRFTSRNL